MTGNHTLIHALGAHGEYARLKESLLNGEGPASVFGLGEAHRAHICAALSADLNKTVLIVSATESSAARLCEDISAYVDNAAHLPAREHPLAIKGYAASAGLTSRRISALEQLLSGVPCVITLSAHALMQRLVPPEAMRASCITISCGDTLDPMELIKKLVLCGYERVELCEGRGQVCLRGGYVDVFPVTAQNPVRIEFFGDEIDTMRSYDPVSQRALDNIDCAYLTPADEMPITPDARTRAMKKLKYRERLSEEYETLKDGATPAGAYMLLPFFYTEETTVLDYLSEDAVILVDEPSRIEESAKVANMEFLDGLGALLEQKNAEPEQAGLLCSPMETIKRLDSARTAMLFALTRAYALISPKCLFRFDTRPATVYIGADDMLVSDLKHWRKNGTSVLLYAGAHAHRLQDRLADLEVILPVTERIDRDLVPGEAIIVSASIQKGFEYPEIKLVALSEAELYGTVTRKQRSKTKKRPSLIFSELSAGDLVVHELHGVGRFAGVETLTVDGVSRDYLHLVYSGGDKLYIPTDQLDRVQKYIGGEEEAQKLSKLGSGDWQRTVSRTRESVKKLAFDLVKLYGERSKLKGFAFSPDTPWQKKLEESFPYEETPDQLTSIDEIKRDMESARVMDRLLCGDVGYGKTEVALRAAFKAVMDSKQVAFLVPTTILAAQHYNTLTSRFSGFPVNVRLLSRFNSPAEEKEILKSLESGMTDVVVGTHKLLSKSIKYRDLGLLIVDEEQRFGVGHKEQIKDMKRAVDVLTLSATPIPRTLHMSMTGIRDMSVIDTPPEQRYPVQTYVMEYEDAVAREAILKEIGRGGQTYFVYNRVRSMEMFADRLRTLVPEARIACAHGQMNEHVLEKTMLDFMDGEYDVLLCSTIIESGLDMNNVNTILIYDADKMGLSQLYQLRGRVGRGARLGYAYFTFRRDKVLTEVAEKRLSAIREFTQFGSGFRIAMRDLEIRGAGNLLGPEQHGHMAAVGYDLYCKIVDTAVREAKGEEIAPEIDAVVEIPLSASIPHRYIPRENDRLSMYKRIALIRTDDDMMDVQDELIDRFGEIPAQVQNLLYVAKLKSAAAAAYLSRVMVKSGEIRLAFVQNAPVDFMKLYALVSNTLGAQIISGDEPTVVIRRKNADVPELCRDLPQFVYTLKDCTDTKR